jgi:hypothetical protein
VKGLMILEMSFFVDPPTLHDASRMSCSRQGMGDHLRMRFLLERQQFAVDMF